MCGIAGFAGGGCRIDLDAMSAALRHRGPDGEGAWTDPDAAVWLAHRRLAIIDRQGGGQPMCTADGQLVVVYNGEIYNHLALRRELEDAGHRFRSAYSDTEVLLHGYRRWGTRLPERLNGMWAFALYDRARRRLFLSRDRFGQKPLFYTLQNGTFAFASELSSLVRHSGVAASVSPRSVQKYFAYGFIPAPNTVFQAIHKLPAGHNLLIDVAELALRVERYWDFQLEPGESPPGAEQEWIDRLHELLDRAVTRRLMSDAPLGVFLSGGTDSSCVAALARARIPGQRLKTFTLRFDDPTFDESGYARRVAGALDTDHHSAAFPTGDVLALAGDVVDRLDEPMADPSLLPTSVLCRTARSQITVALGGDGADELFAGYDPFRALRIARLYARVVPRPVHAAIRLLAALLPAGRRYMSLDFKIKRALRGLSFPPPLWNPAWLGPLSPDELGELFIAPVDLEDVYSEAIALWDSSPAHDFVDRTMQFYVKLYLQDGILVKLDRAGMLESMELRCPFLDIELVDFVRRIPQTFKLRRGTGKYLLKKLAERFVPRDVVYRPKHGFPFPVGTCFRENRLPGHADRALPGQDPAFLTRKSAEHARQRADHGAFLWSQWVMHRFQRRIAAETSAQPAALERAVT